MSKTLQFNSMSSLISLPKTGLFLGDSLIVSGMVENPTATSRRVKVGIRVVRVSDLRLTLCLSTTANNISLLC